MSNAAKLAALGRTAQAGLTNLLYPSVDGGWNDVYRSGWLPTWFNQRWGGAQWGELPDGSGKGDFATGYIEDTNPNPIVFGNGTGTVYFSQGFVVSQSITNPTIWLKMNKNGAPGDDLTVAIHADNAGVPGSMLGSASAPVSGRTVSQSTSGQWISFAPAPGTLNGNTQYHIVVRRLGATDATNYYAFKGVTVKRYPFGNNNTGTAGLVWTTFSTQAICFLVQNTAATSHLRTGGKFDNAKFVFNEGTPLDQSKSLSQGLLNFFDGDTFTALIRGDNFSKDKTIADFYYGHDHDRIVVRADAVTGYPWISLYDKNGVVYTVAGNVDLSNGSHYDIGLKVRMRNDGGDYLHLYINGAQMGVPFTGQSFDMSPRFRQAGTAILGGGFPLAPVWSVNQNGFSVLPSSTGWTYVGTSAETAGYAVVGGVLYQTGSGVASTSASYYTRTTTLSNATGWTVTSKLKLGYNPDTINEASCSLQVNDGAKTIRLYINNDYLQARSVGGTDVIYHGDFRSTENVYTVCGRGSDYYVFCNGKLVIDGTGLMTEASATNNIIFGDASTTAGQNAEAAWYYVKAVNSFNPPQASSGASLSEFAYWSGDKSGLLSALYGNGTVVSVKDMVGVERNYVNLTEQIYVARGISSAPVTSSTGLVPVPDMELFCLGQDLEISTQTRTITSTAPVAVFSYPFVDGLASRSQTGYTSNNVSSTMTSIASDSKTVPAGLHKVELRWSVSTGTVTNEVTNRNMFVKSS
jgi:hypothetical protein